MCYVSASPHLLHEARSVDRQTDLSRNDEVRDTTLVPVPGHGEASKLDVFVNPGMGRLSDAKMTGAREC